MDLAPWKVMLGLSGILVVLAIASTVGGMGPGQLFAAILLAVVFVGTGYLGYRIGGYLRER